MEYPPTNQPRGSRMDQLVPPRETRPPAPACRQLTTAHMDTVRPASVPIALPNQYSLDAGTVPPTHKSTSLSRHGAQAVIAPPAPRGPTPASPTYPCAISLPLTFLAPLVPADGLVARTGLEKKCAKLKE